MSSDAQKEQLASLFLDKFQKGDLQAVFILADYLAEAENVGLAWDIFNNRSIQRGTLDYYFLVHLTEVNGGGDAEQVWQWIFWYIFISRSYGPHEPVHPELEQAVVPEIRSRLQGKLFHAFGYRTYGGDCLFEYFTDRLEVLEHLNNTLGGNDSCLQRDISVDDLSDQELFRVLDFFWRNGYRSFSQFLGFISA